MMNLVEESINHEFFGICVPPFWVKKVRREIGAHPITLITVIGFPFGYQKTESRITEIASAIEDGADELDIVFNISAFKSGMDWAKIDLVKCNQLIHQSEKLSKVIIETGYLTKQEILDVTTLCVDSGTDFVKTSTGVLTSGAQLEDIVSIKTCVGDKIGIKASGGIKTLSQMEGLVGAGADRIGTSSGVVIMKEYNERYSR